LAPAKGGVERYLEHRCQLYKAPTRRPFSKTEVNVMNNIIYLVGAVVIVLFILSFVGIV